MPTFMDVHTLDEGVAAEDVAAAHKADLETQTEYGVNYKRYFVNKEGTKIFCVSMRPMQIRRSESIEKLTAW